MSDNCIVTDSDEFAEVSVLKLVRGRKPWTCCECGDAIDVGDLHEHAKLLYDGAWDEYRTCARCMNVRTDYFDGWFYGMMVEQFQEVHGIDYRKGIPSDLTPCRKAS